MADPILDDLNPAQRDAVLHGEGPLMVLAGAGSGKTRVITRRIARLLRDGVRSGQILALTFTNKAAGEMARRVRELGGGWVRVATFHSACARFLREDGQRLGYPRDFTIYDTYDRDSAIKLLMQDRGLDSLGVKPAVVGRRISQLKNAGMTPDDFIVGRGTADQIVTECFGAYQELLFRHGALDFDDLLGRFLDLLREHPDVREAYQERFQWLLIDEFQDTNRVQYELMRRLTGPRENLCVVGDPDQSIYRFRGADIRNILDFERDYPAVTTIRLEHNYRSSACILRAADSVIQHNAQRLDKHLVTDAEEGEQITFYRAAGPAQESREITTRIESLIFGGIDPEQVAVFYRSHFLSRAIEEALRERGIPHRVVGGLTFFERREVKDLLAFLKVVVNPLDDVSMARVINVPPRGIGAKTLARVRDLGAKHGASLAEVVCEEALCAELAPKARKGLAELAGAIEAARACARESAHAALQVLCERIGYVEHVGGLGDPEDVARVENVEELHSDAKTFDDDVGGGLSAYLQHVSLMTDQDRDEDEHLPRVSLMTVHAAKGLEFDHVFVSGLEDGLFPNLRSLEEDGDVEEERRLMYVAMTRARKTLWIGSSRVRMVAGQLVQQIVSPFIKEIDPSCVMRVSSVSHLDEAADDLEVVRGDAWDETVGEAEFEYSQEEAELAEGARVVHAVYGHGTVLDVQGRGTSAKVRVRFEKAGDRLLVVEHAGLQIVPSQSEW